MIQNQPCSRYHKVTITRNVPFIVIDGYWNRTRARIDDEEGLKTLNIDTTVPIFTLEGNEDFEDFSDGCTTSLLIGIAIEDTFQDALNHVTKFKQTEFGLFQLNYLNCSAFFQLRRYTEDFHRIQNSTKEQRTRKNRKTLYFALKINVVMDLEPFQQRFKVVLIKYIFNKMLILRDGDVKQRVFVISISKT